MADYLGQRRGSVPRCLRRSLAEVIAASSTDAEAYFRSFVAQLTVNYRKVSRSPLSRGVLKYRTVVQGETVAVCVFIGDFPTGHEQTRTSNGGMSGRKCDLPIVDIRIFGQGPTIRDPIQGSSIFGLQ